MKIINQNIKNILLLIFAVFIVGSVSAQKKVVKKPLAKPKNYVGPPPPIMKPITEPAPPSISIIESKATGNPAPPMISVSPQEAKYEREKICTDCDTLVLEPGKPHMVIYDVKWMADRESRSYRKQPTKNDLITDYYGMRGLVKREWDELQQNFPANEINYHHVYRNTFIKIPNDVKQNLSLLNRQERHEGYLYWSGKPDSRILQGTKMAMLTEKIAKALGATKTSSYYASFKKDSLTVEKLMQTTRADETIQPNMNGFLQKEILGEYILPFQFMDLKNVSSITLKPNGKEELTFKFNKSGQLVEYIDGKDEHQIITYKDNLPLNISRDGKLKIHLFYQGDVVSAKDDYSLESYQLIGKLFLESARYSIEKSDYEELKIKGEREYKIFLRNGQTCLDYSSEDKTTSICYSNNLWSLPITMTETYGGDSQTKTLSINAAGALEVENANKYKSSKMIYKLENGIIKTFHSTQKRGENDYIEPKAIQVIYTFFK